MSHSENDERYEQLRLDLISWIDAKPQEAAKLLLTMVDLAEYDELACESACNFDPLPGVIGVQF